MIAKPKTRECGFVLGFKGLCMLFSNTIEFSLKSSCLHPAFEPVFTPQSPL